MHALGLRLFYDGDALLDRKESLAAVDTVGVVHLVVVPPKVVEPLQLLA